MAFQRVFQRRFFGFGLALWVAFAGQALAQSNRLDAPATPDSELPRGSTGVLPPPDKVASESVDPAAGKADATEPATALVAERKRKIEPFLATAETALKRFENEIRGYTCVMVKRERVAGELIGRQYVWMKVRLPREKDGKTIVPRSVYLRFMKPKTIEGREVLYVEGQRNGAMLARHGGPGLLKNVTFQLDPEGKLALEESRYPVYKAGIQFLLQELIRRMETDLVENECQLTEHERAEVDKRQCRHFEVRSPSRDSGLDFQVAHVLMDEELRLPVYFASYDWGEKDEDPPVLVEEYIFTRLKLNPGLTEADFQRDHPDYRFLPADKESDSSAVDD